MTDGWFYITHLREGTTHALKVRGFVGIVEDAALGAWKDHGGSWNVTDLVSGFALSRHTRKKEALSRPVLEKASKEASRIYSDKKLWMCAVKAIERCLDSYLIDPTPEAGYTYSMIMESAQYDAVVDSCEFDMGFAGYR